MNPYVNNIEELSVQNETFRTVLFTTKNSQLVLMSLLPGEDIGTETHQIDQFIRVEQGAGETILEGKKYAVKDGSAIVVPAGVEHNLINTSKTESLKLYTIYMPPEHRADTVHLTKAEAETDSNDHYIAGN